MPAAIVRIARASMSSAALMVCVLVVGQSSPRVLTPPGPEIGPDYVLPRRTWVYEPPYFTCYSRHRNWLDCYPSFHEQYYRRPYNYRVLFDYPWHEDLHGPVPADGAACGEVWVGSAPHLAPPPGGDLAPESAARPQRPPRAAAPTLSPPARRAVYLKR
jgi:hypothetical protein